jgi:NAD(P)-dependent dehydrogenase (short-subunit alcohol dehydrogenase family)
LSSDEVSQRICDEALDQLGGIDILVNNAGAVLRLDNPPWRELAPQEWIDSFNLNVVASVRLSRVFTLGMEERAGAG